MRITNKSDVYTCLQAYEDAAVLGTALELGLFWLLAERPLDAPGIAQALSIPLNRCRYWLQLLESMGLLDRCPEGYVPSAVARTAILDVYSHASWALLAKGEREQAPAVTDLALHIREPGPVQVAQGLTLKNYVQRMVDDPEQARRFTYMLYELHQPLASQVAALVDLAGVERMMDLGGGSGVASFALLRRQPGLTSVVVDIPGVCAAGRDIAAHERLADRIGYYPADFTRDELPPGGFDLVLHCDCNVYGEALYRKVWHALNPGGRLVVVDHFAPAEDVASAGGLYWTFLDSLADPDIGVVTADQIRAQIVSAGFELVAEARLPNDRLLIQACKEP